MNHTTNNATSESVLVSLVSGADGADSVARQLANGAMVMMTPAQARSLATSLITSVNRAEVKASLRVSTNLRRRMDEPEGHLHSLAR
jgi:2-polyprenyl-6-methoxyphenol hydroxylase-like FAD-dependent oxidoreductase